MQENNNNDNQIKPRKKKTGIQVKQFFSKYGFYMLMLVCVAAIAASAFLTGAFDPPQVEQEGVDVNMDRSETLDDVEDGAPGEGTITPTPSPSPSPSPSPGATDGGEEAATEAELFKPSLNSPISGEVAAPFVLDKLVFNETMNMWSTHNGIDIVAEEGSPVVSALSGEVENIDQDSSNVCIITLIHSDNQKTIYNGVVDVAVKEGDKVSMGQQLGTVGIPAFEAHLGPHIHFEYILNNQYKDPQQFIEK